jgi:hypothetical protein
MSSSPWLSSPSLLRIPSFDDDLRSDDCLLLKEYKLRETLTGPLSPIYVSCTSSAICSVRHPRPHIPSPSPQRQPSPPNLLSLLLTDRNTSLPTKHAPHFLPPLRRRPRHCRHRPPARPSTSRADRPHSVLHHPPVLPSLKLHRPCHEHIL